MLTPCPAPSVSIGIVGATAAEVPWGQAVPASWAGSCWHRQPCRPQVRAGTCPWALEGGRLGVGQRDELSSCHSPRCPPALSSAAGGRPCDAKDFGHGSLVCACSATYCDTLDPLVLPAPGSYVKYESSKAGKRLERSEGSFQHNAKSPGTTLGCGRACPLTGGRGGDTVCPHRFPPDPGHNTEVPEGEGLWRLHH